MAGAGGSTNYKMAGTANGTFGYSPPFTHYYTTEKKKKQNAMEKAGSQIRHERQSLAGFSRKTWQCRRSAG
jgi:hypothetical protein